MTNIPSFSYRNTRRGIILTIIAMVAILVITIIFAVNPNKPRSLQSGGMAFPATLPAIASGCGDIYRIPPVEGNFGVIPDEFYTLNAPDDVDIPRSSLTVVPIFGYMSKTGLTRDQIRFYSQEEITQGSEEGTESTFDETKMLRSMYDNNLLVIWYTKDLPDADVAFLRSYANVDRPGEVLVLPWTDSRPLVQPGRNVAFASWGESQTCNIFDEFVLGEFIDFVADNPVEKPAVIPEAKLTANNKLMPIGPSLENR